MFRARSNSLKLAWRNRFLGGSTECQLCGRGLEETLTHFIKDCSHYRDLRLEYDMESASVPEILLFTVGCQVNMAKKYVGVIWRRRCKSLKERNQQ